MNDSRLVDGKMFSIVRWFEPAKMMPTFWSTKLIPIAEISGASFGECRSGRYASRSMATFSPAVIAIVIARVATIWATIATGDSPAASVKMPSPPDAVGASSPNAMTDPIMNTSPWAKLISSMMP